MSRKRRFFEHYPPGARCAHVQMRAHPQARSAREKEFAHQSVHGAEQAHAMSVCVFAFDDLWVRSRVCVERHVRSKFVYTIMYVQTGL